MFRLTLLTRKLQCTNRALCAATVTEGSNTVPRHQFQPFSRRDEEELVRVISTKPRHVLKHVRQLVWRSRKRELNFRNTATQLMILLQDQLRKQLLDPQHASSIMEGVLEECVKLQQHDMAHLLFRAFLRFRKYGCVLSIDALRHVFESYKTTDSSDLMTQLASEMSYDPELRPFCIAAYLFAGNVEEAEKVRASVPLPEMTPLDIVAIIEGYDKCGLREKGFELLEGLTALKCKGEELMPIYRAAIRLCNQQDDLDGLQRLFDLTEQQEVPLDNGMYANVLRLRMRHVASVDDIQLIETELAQRGYVPDITGNSILISAHARLQHYGDRGSEEVMLSKVEALLGSIEARLQQGDPELDITSAHLRAVIRGFGAAGRPEMIKAAWPRLQCNGISDTPRVYNELLKWYALMGNVKDVLATKEEMDQKNIHCDSTGYAWILRALGKYYPRHVENIFEEIQERRVRPDIGLYTTLVGILGDLGDFTKLETIEAEVRAREESDTLQTTPLYYAVLIRVHVKNLPKVIALHNAAASKGFLEHHHVVSILLHAYATHPDGREKLEELLATLPRPWSTETYNVLLNMHGRANEGEKVKELLDSMRKEQVAMNDVTFGTLITTFGRMNDTQRVREIISLLKDKEGTVSSHFYSVLAATLSRMGDAEGLNDVWTDLLSSKLVVDTEVYNQFLALYGKHHNIVQMQNVMETMMRQVPPNPVTATTVLDVLGKSGRITEMEALLVDMKHSADAKPTAVTYHQVLNAYAKTGDVGKMEKLYEEMIAEGINVQTPVTYNILADGYGRSKRFEQMEELLKRRASAGVEMDELGYCVIIASYGRIRSQPDIKRLADAARTQYPHLIARKMAWSFVDAFCRCRDYSNMHEWVREVEKLASSGEGEEAATSSKKPEAGAADGNKEEKDAATTTSTTTSASTTTTSSTDSKTPTTRCTGDSDKMALIAYYCRAGLMDDAERLVADIETRTELSYSSLNALARGFASAGRFDRAVAVLHKMRDRDFVPDASTALALSAAFLRAGLHEQAQQVIQWRRKYAKAASGQGDAYGDEDYPKDM